MTEAEWTGTAAQANPPFRWTVEGKGHHADAVFTNLTLGEGLRVVVQDSRAIGSGDRSLPEGLGEQQLLDINPRFRNAVLTRPRLCALVQLGESSAYVEVAGESEQGCRAWIDEIFAALPQPEEFDANTAITFWSGREEGDGQPRHRRIDASPWTGAAAGYERGVAKQLETMFALRPPIIGGRLLLWFGEPGTGKTYALRALAHEWREWCAVHVVTDPERLLGGPMAYLTEVLTVPDLERQAKREWKLIVLEDAGELLSIDARERAGQGLSRLLNASDGLLAQGANAMFLITTNEPLGAIHPAVHRPGRCLSEIEFLALPAKQANEWLERQRSDARVATPAPLAELFAIRDGRGRSGSDKPRIGFAA